MDDIFSGLTRFVEQNLIGVVLLVSLLGSFWGVMAEISQNLERNQEINLDVLPSPKFRLSFNHWKQLALPCLSLTIVNVIFSSIFYLLFLLIFWGLNQLFENVWMQLLIAFSITKAINRKQGNISFINAYLGGFDLNDIPIVRDFVNSLTESYRNWISKQHIQVREIVDKIYRYQAEEEFAKQADKVKEIIKNSQKILDGKNPDELLGEIQNKINFWPDPAVREKLNQRLLEIQKLQDLSKRQTAIVILYLKIHPSIDDL